VSYLGTVSGGSKYYWGRLKTEAGKGCRRVWYFADT